MGPGKAVVYDPSKPKVVAAGGTGGAPWVGWELPPPAPVKQSEGSPVEAAGGKRREQEARQQIQGALGLGANKHIRDNQQHTGIEVKRTQIGGDASVVLGDGTTAMVRCMRKGHGALECPVCLQLFNQPVTPVGGDCKCTFCFFSSSSSSTSRFVCPPPPPPCGVRMSR